MSLFAKQDKTIPIAPIDVREWSQEIKRQVQIFLEAVIFPRIDKSVDLQVQAQIESIIEKKIEERFAFAIELLRSMNEKAKVE